MRRIESVLSTKGICKGLTLELVVSVILTGELLCWPPDPLRNSSRQIGEPIGNRTGEARPFPATLRAMGPRNGGRGNSGAGTIRRGPGSEVAQTQPRCGANGFSSRGLYGSHHTRPDISLMGAISAPRSSVCRKGSPLSQELRARIRANKDPKPSKWTTGSKSPKNLPDIEEGFGHLRGRSNFQNGEGLKMWVPGGKRVKRGRNWQRDSVREEREGKGGRTILEKDFRPNQEE